MYNKLSMGILICAHGEGASFRLSFVPSYDRYDHGEIFTKALNLLEVDYKSK